MLRPFVFLFGYTSYSFPANASHLVAELCRQKRRVYRRMELGEEVAYIELPLLSSAAFERDCMAAGIPLTGRRHHGLPALVYGYRKRAGLFAGAALFLFLSIFSGSLLWDVRVEGNSRLSDREVVALLEECGLSVGMYARGIPTAEIETLALINSEDIAWISINILGSIAEVHIIEDSGEDIPDLPGSDIVAERGGVIQWLEDIRGWQAVEIGQQVEEGQLLIGGKYPAEEGMGARYTTPRGRVFAATEREFSVSIPLKYEKKKYTGREKCEKYFIFFKKEVKFFKNSGKMYTEYDTIDTVEYINFFSAGELPVGVRTVKHMEYVYEDAERTPEEAERLADYKLSCDLAALADDGELLRKSKVYRVTDTAYIIDCHIQRIENIAERREIKIEGLS